MHETRCCVKGDAVTQRKANEITGSLEADGLRDTKGLSFLARVHVTEFALNEKGTEHRVVEKIENGEDQLW